MSTFELVMLFISLMAFYTWYKINKSLKSDGNSFMQRESARILFENAKVDDSYTSEGRVYTRGLSLSKNNKTGKYNLTPQAKVCDIGLY